MHADAEAVGEVGVGVGLAGRVGHRDQLGTAPGEGHRAPGGVGDALQEVAGVVGKGPADARLILDAQDMTAGFVDLGGVLLAGQRVAAVRVAHDTGDRGGFVLGPDIGAGGDELDPPPVRALRPEQAHSVNGGRCQRIVEIAQPVLAEQPKVGPVMVVRPIEKQRHLAAVGDKVGFSLNLVSRRRDDRVAEPANSMGVFVRGRGGVGRRFDEIVLIGRDEGLEEAKTTAATATAANSTEYAALDPATLRLSSLITLTDRNAQLSESITWEYRCRPEQQQADHRRQTRLLHRRSP